MPASIASEQPESGPIHPLDARRAYYGFLTHLIKAHASGLRWPVHTVAEFGTGTHLGIGLCALLAGAKRYIGFDAVKHMDPNAQHELLADLREMFLAGAPAVRDDGVKAFDFPTHIIAKPPSDEDIADIAANLGALARGGDSERLSYVAPYGGDCADRYAEWADFILSTATLEHVDDMAGGYRLFGAMLKRGAYMSHSIDFKSHGFGAPSDGKRRWNEHWMATDEQWAELTRGRAYSINRLSCSKHLELMLQAGFELKVIAKRMQDHDLKWSNLAPRFQWMTAEDLGCSGVHVIAQKPSLA